MSATPTKDLALFTKFLGLKVGDQFLLAYGEGNRQTLLATVGEDGLTSGLEIFKNAGYQPQPYSQQFSYEELRELAKVQNLFYLPSLAIAGRGNGDLPTQAPAYLYAEIDTLALAAQTNFWRQFTEQTGLEPLLVFTGGKSLHAYIKLDEQPTWEDWRQAQQILCAYAQSDLAVTRPHQPMRLPGFPRIGKDGVEREVEIVQACDRSYSLTHVLERLECSWPYAQDYSLERWALYVSICTRRNNPLLELPDGVSAASAFEEKDEAKLEQRIKPQKQITAAPCQPRRVAAGDTVVETVRGSIEQKLAGMGAQAYAASEYHFNFNGDRGNSPFSETNSSGTAFKLFSDGGWYCHASDMGGPSASSFYAQLWNNGWPHGKDYIEFLRKLGSLVGVDTSKLDQFDPADPGAEFAKEIQARDEDRGRAEEGEENRREHSKNVNRIIRLFSQSKRRTNPRPKHGFERPKLKPSRCTAIVPYNQQTEELFVDIQAGEIRILKSAGGVIRHRDNLKIELPSPRQWLGMGRPKLRVASLELEPDLYEALKLRQWDEWQAHWESIYGLSPINLSDLITSAPSHLHADKVNLDEYGVPNYRHWVEAGRPHFECDRNNVQHWLEQLRERGYTDIILDGYAGSGKSTLAGIVLQDYQENPEYDGDSVKRSFFFHRDYRNPTVASIEELPETPTGGALTLKDEATPLGNPVRKRAMPGDEVYEQLCVEDGNIQRLNELGIAARRGKDSDFCNNCAHREGCPYLQAMEEALEMPALRSHLTKGIKGKGAIAIVDEATTQIEAHQTIHASQEEMHREWAFLSTSLDYSSIHLATEPVTSAIVRGLNRAIEERGLYGLSHDEVLDFLPRADEIAQLDSTMHHRAWAACADAWIEPALNVWDSDKTQTPLVADQLIKHLRKALQPDIEGLIRGRSTPDEKAEAIEASVFPGVISRAIAILNGAAGRITIQPNGDIQFSYPSGHHRKTLEKFDARVYMDATVDARELSLKLKKSARHMAHLAPPKPSYANLRINIVHGIGACGQQRYNTYRDARGRLVKADSPYSVENRLIAAVAVLAESERERGRRLALTDNKRYIDNYRNIPNIEFFGWNWVHTRGCDAMGDFDSLIAINPKPISNLLQVQTEWEILSGETGGAQSLIQSRAIADMLQVPARLRSHNQPERPKTVWLISDAITEADIEQLKEEYPGATIEIAEAKDITPKAARKGVQTDMAIIEAMCFMIKAGQHPSLRGFARETGFKRATVGAFAGTYNTTFERLLLLLEALNSKDGHPITDYESLAAIEYLIPEWLDGYDMGQASSEETIEILVDALEVLGDDVSGLASETIQSLYLFALQVAPDEIIFSLADSLGWIPSMESKAEFLRT